MKKINKIFMAAAMAAAVACAEKADFAGTSDNDSGLVPMTFNGVSDGDAVTDAESGEPVLAGVMTRTSYHGRLVCWEEGDAISVFFNTGNSISKQPFVATEFKKGTEGNAQNYNMEATFSGLGIPSAGSFVAVYPDADANAYDGTGITVNIPSEQVAVTNGFAPGSNVAVAYSTDQSLQFRNVGALIAFRFETQEDADKAASVTFKAKSVTGEGYVGLTGNSVVTLQDGVPVAGEGSNDYVTVVAPEGGFKEAGSIGRTYYVPVYPFSCSAIEIIYTDKDGKTYIKNNDTPKSVVRNRGLNFGVIPEPFSKPDEIVIDLDFTDNVWPFTPECAAQNAQTAEGEKYTYNFADAPADVTDKTLDFVISKGSLEGAQGYRFGPKSGKDFSILVPAIGAGDAWIKLPAIPGRHLKSVKVTHCNTSAKRFRVQKYSTTTSADSQHYYYCPNNIIAPDDDTFVDLTVSFPCSESGLGRMVTTDANTSYYIFFPGDAGKGITIGKIVLTYSVRKP